jgi:FYVE/RhoGEF/PH domain-containing protein 5/6
LILPLRDEHGRLADIFVKKGPYLKMYSTYIRDFENNVALLDKQNRKNLAFAAVVREFEVNGLTGTTCFLCV